MARAKRGRCAESGATIPSAWFPLYGRRVLGLPQRRAHRARLDREIRAAKAARQEWIALGSNRRRDVRRASEPEPPSDSSTHSEPLASSDRAQCGRPASARRGLRRSVGQHRRPAAVEHGAAHRDAGRATDSSMQTTSCWTNSLRTHGDYQLVCVVSGGAQRVVAAKSAKPHCDLCRHDIEVGLRE